MEFGVGLRAIGFSLAVGMGFLGSLPGSQAIAGTDTVEKASWCDSQHCDPSSCDSMNAELMYGGCDGCRGIGMNDLVIRPMLDWKRLLRPSDHCFDDFISPMINFVHFEDPRTLTELRPIFVTHQFPSTLGPANIPAGGSAQLFALQFRIALTERLSLIAVKDGYIVDSSQGALDGLLDSGWADVSAGLKYNLIRNANTGTLLSTGFTYEIPMGSQRALQAIGDGEFHFFATGGQRMWNGNGHVLSSIGYRVPVDNDVQETSINWNNHFDVRLTDRLYLFTENSWWHWTDDANVGAPLGVAGQDLLNLNATNIAGNNLVTQNVGLKLKPNRHTELGAAFEFPLTRFKDIIENRVQLEAIIRY